MKKLTLLAALLANLAVAPAFAGSVAGTGGATEVTQWQNMGLLSKQLSEQIRTYEQMVQSVQTQLQQLDQLRMQGKTLSDGQWSNAIESLRTLNQVVQGSQGISYAMQSADQQFQARYPGYQDTMIQQMRQNGQVPIGFAQRSEQMSNGVIDSSRGALAAAGYQASQFESEDALLRNLKAQSNNAVGQMQAIQAGNQISGFMVDELRKQRQLNMAMMQSQTNWVAYQTQKAVNDEESAKANASAMARNTNKAADDAIAKSTAARRAALGSY